MHATRTQTRRVPRNWHGTTVRPQPRIMRYLISLGRVEVDPAGDAPAVDAPEDSSLTVSALCCRPIDPFALTMTVSGLAIGRPCGWPGADQPVLATTPTGWVVAFRPRRSPA